MPVPARVAALGGNLISVKDKDASLSLDNPSLLNEEMHNSLGLTYVNYLTDINYGMFSYTRHAQKYGTFSAGLRYLNYGRFTETDEAANIIGSFSASDYVFHAGWGYAIDTAFSVGANVKTIYSAWYEYSSLAIALDAAGTYYNQARGFTFAAVLKNMGTSLKTFTENNRENLPFEIQAGISKKFSNMPFRFSFIFHNLQQWKLESIENQPQGLNPLEEEKRFKRFRENFFRHLIAGMEFLPSENFSVRIGLNYNRRQEMLLRARPGIIGFSGGFGFKVNRFHLSYALAAYHLGVFSNHFTITTRIADFFSTHNPDTLHESAP